MKMSKEDIKLKCNKNFWQLAPDEETGAANLYIYSEVESDGVDFVQVRKKFLIRPHVILKRNLTSWAMSVRLMCTSIQRAEMLVRA